MVDFELLPPEVVVELSLLFPPETFCVTALPLSSVTVAPESSVTMTDEFSLSDELPLP